MRRYLDRDGRSDVAVGTRSYCPQNSGANCQGEVLIYSGKEGTLLHGLKGKHPQDGFGWAVAAMSDLDGDMVNELIVGAPGISSNEVESSSTVYLFSGKTGKPLREWMGENKDSRLGTSVSRAGDVNGDGKDDVIVGASGPGYPQPPRGGAYVYSGADGSLIHRLIFGEGVRTVVGLDDLDGDGKSDFAVGVPDFSIGKDISVGKVVVFSGATGQVLCEKQGSSAVNQLQTQGTWMATARVTFSQERARDMPTSSLQKNPSSPEKHYSRTALLPRPRTRITARMGRPRTLEP